MSEYRNLTRNLLRLYRTAEPRFVEAGLEWYDMAYTHCERLGAFHGFETPRVAVALAHLSPRIAWKTNLFLLEELLAGREKPSYAMTRSWEMGRRALEAEHPMTTFSVVALKTGSFARAILGDANSVVVDVWAARAAGVGESMIRSTRGYHAVAEAYRRGAKRVGIPARDLQAVTWCAVRGSAA